jgi:hypothetical protein
VEDEPDEAAHGVALRARLAHHAVAAGLHAELSGDGGLNAGELARGDG